MSDDDLPDVRDGLTRAERIVLVTLAELQAERGGHDVPTPMLYGRVVEKLSAPPPVRTDATLERGAAERPGAPGRRRRADPIDLSVEDLQRILRRLAGRLPVG